MKIPFLAKTVCVDFETYWDTDFTLSKLSTSEYIRDPRFKVHCAAISVGGKKPKVVWGHDEVGEALRKIDWTTHALVAQNTAFDGFIMSHCYGIVPCFYFDTKSMANGLHKGVLRASLKFLAPAYGVGRKDDSSLQSTKGCAEIPKEWRKAFAQYNSEDCEQCWGIFVQQMKVFPPRELQVIDLVIRMFCDSVLLIAEKLAREGLAAEMIARRSEILKSGATEEELMSNDKFAALLGKYITVPTKISAKTGKVAWALAQTDEAFIELQDHEDVRVVRLVCGRLAAKSTQAETRAYRLIEAGKNGQKLPVGYTYSAAITHRFGGTNKLNLQNLPRVNKKEPKPSDALRRSIIAPPGHVLVVCDSAQIEARTNAWLGGQEDMLEVFRDPKKDPYCHMAESIYGRSIDKEKDKDERAIGKATVLGLGYGMGHRKFQTTLALGTLGPPIDMPLGDCQRIVNLYRRINDKIVRAWREAETMLRQMAAGNSGTAFNDLIEYDSTTMWLPNGMPIHYPQLRMSEGGDMSYNTLEGRKKIYGSKCIENLVQALARIIVVEQMLDVVDYLSTLKLKRGEVARVCLMTHDEIVACVPKRFADTALKAMLIFMRTAPAWCSDLPLDAEGGWDTCYSK